MDIQKGQFLDLEANQKQRRKRDKNDTGRTIAQKIIDEYQPKNVDEMQDALKDIFGPMFEAMLQGEMDSHLGYKSNERGG
ncbi:MAG: hypothetical protein LIV24_11455, partial [Eubacterium sp.]|nr:hypothetical protein [Eubacterium sp.]